MNKFYRLFFIIIIAVMCVLLLNANETIAKKSKKGPSQVDVQIKDGIHIISEIDIPKEAKVKNKVPLVVFLHSIGRDSTEWGPFPEMVKKQLNVATLTIDFRGHGKSNFNAKGKKVYWQYFTEKSYKKFPDDVLDVLNYVKKQYPEIDITKIALVGSSLGANTALMTGSYSAIKKDVNISTIIMLSPMLNYKGFDLRLPIVRYGEKPLLFMVSRKDNYSYNSCTELIKFAQGKKMLKVYPSGGDGVALIKFKEDAGSLIINWIKDSLNSSATTAAAAPRKQKI